VLSLPRLCQVHYVERQSQFRTLNKWAHIVTQVCPCSTLSYSLASLSCPLFPLHHSPFPSVGAFRCVCVRVCLYVNAHKYVSMVFIFAFSQYARCMAIIYSNKHLVPLQPSLSPLTFYNLPISCSPLCVPHSLGACVE
jgi:hypothetical protein